MPTNNLLHVLVCVALALTCVDQGYSPPISDISFTIEDIRRSLNASGINFSYLLDLYNKLCRSESITCWRRCSCEKQCVETMSCCPDCKYAYIGTGCHNVAILGQDGRILIDACPITFTGRGEIKDKCMSNSSELAPVSSGELDFINRFCAECHGVQNFSTWDIVIECKKRLDAGNLKLDSRLEKVLNDHSCTVKFKSPENNKANECHLNRFENEIDKCNATGFWKESDSNVLFGCECMDMFPIFYKEIRFKNIFCYHCNPSITPKAKYEGIKSCDMCDLIEKRSLSYDMICNGLNSKLSTLRIDSNDTTSVDMCENIDRRNGKSKARLTICLCNFNEMFTKIKPMLLDLYANSSLVNLETGTKYHEKSRRTTFSEEQIQTYAAICGNDLVCDRSLLSKKYPEMYEDRLNTDGLAEGRKRSHSFKEKQVSHNESDYIYNLSRLDHVNPNTNPVCDTSCTCNPSCVITDRCCVDTLIMKEPFICYSEKEFPSINSLDNNNKSRAMPINDKRQTHKSYSLISRCLSNSSSYLNDKCSGANNTIDILTLIPIGKFRNMYCLMCNNGGVADGVSFEMQLDCNSYLENSLFQDVYTMLKAARGHCKTSFNPSVGGRSCREPYTKNIRGTYYLTDVGKSITNVTFVHRCNTTGYWNSTDYNIRRLCEGDSESILRLPEYRFDTTVYKNFACFECNPMTAMSEVNIVDNCTFPRHPENETLKALCAERPYHVRWFPFKNLYCAMCNSFPWSPKEIKPDLPPFVSELPIYTMREVTMVRATTPVTSNPSDCNGIIKQNVCYVVACGRGRTCQRVPVDDQHVTPTQGLRQIRILSDVSSIYQLKLQVRSPITEKVFNNDTVSLGVMCTTLLNKVWELFDNLTIDISYQCSLYNKSCNKLNVALRDLNFLYVSYDIHVNVSDLHVEVSIENILVDSIAGEHMIRTVAGRQISLVSSDVNKNNQIQLNTSTCTYKKNWIDIGSGYKVIQVDKFLTCRYVELNETEVEFDNESYYITLNGVSYSPEVYEKVGREFRICTDDFDKVTILKNRTDARNVYKVFIFFNFVCVMSSLVCLLLTFITYSIFKTLRTVPGRNIMTLTLSLFWAQLLPILGPSITQDGLGCVIIGALIHFSWLSMFCAMWVCSFHMFRIFYINFMTPPSQDVGQNYTAKYNIFVFGLPLVIVSLVILFHMIETNGAFSGYGRNKRCLLAGIYAILFAFVLPSIVMSIISITFFGMSFHRIRTAPQMSGNKDRRDVAICIKLCTIIGIAWPLQVLDGFLDLSVLSFLAVALNGLQGVFIFVAYICNARILGLYKGLLCGKHNHASSIVMRSTNCKRSCDTNITPV